MDDAYLELLLREAARSLVVDHPGSFLQREEALVQPVSRDYITHWLHSPTGGGIYVAQRDAIERHDVACILKANPWLPRKGGVTCISDLYDCAGGCDVTFFIEGLTAFPEGCESCCRAVYCPCCFARRKRCVCHDEDGE